MRLLARLLAPKVTAHAHCDLPCGVYDPAQARIEADQATRRGDLTKAAEITYGKIPQLERRMHDTEAKLASAEPSCQPGP